MLIKKILEFYTQYMQPASFYQNTEVSDRIGEIVSTFESGEKARPTKERIWISSEES